MNAIRSRIDEENEPDVPFLWDSAWQAATDGSLAGCADWRADSSSGGLQAAAPLETAILLCLFTDRRRPDTLPGDEDEGDPRGWHGDTYDIDKDAGERAMGSLLWTLERAALTDETARLAEHYAREAVQTLIDQGVVERFDIASEVLRDAGQLSLAVVAWGARGERALNRTYSLSLE